jgi:aurora kinase
MLSGNQMKIIDFGWCVHTVKPRLTVCGTLEYLSPEMLFNREYDNSVDVYCLGIVLYELLYLRSPFYEESEADIMKNIKEGVLLFFDNIRNATD